MHKHKQGFTGASFLPDHDLISMDQTHSNQIDFVERNLAGDVAINNNGLPSDFRRDSQIILDANFDVENAQPFQSLRSSVIVRSDAVIAQGSNLILSVRTADCMPILIIAKPFIAVVHAGREGTLNNILYRVAVSLSFLGGQDPLVWFGPHSCVCCYEIHRESQTHFDMLEENKQQLKQGFNANYNLIESPFCTQCHHDMFFSYRSGDLKKRNIFYLQNRV